MTALAALPSPGRRPPRKLAEQGKGPRTIDGLLLDVAGAARLLGLSEKMLRARVARRQVPFRRLQGRVCFVRAELERFLDCLDGCGVDEAVAKTRPWRT